MSETALPWNPAYVERHLIAYLGNKRRLLGLIHQAVEHCRTQGQAPVQAGGLFLDLFSGTGVVSRLARSLGFRAVANDWEDYAVVLSRAFLEWTSADLACFDAEGGLTAVIEALNQAAGDASVQHDGYLTQHYCPADDLHPDSATERLFWTRHNGARLDRLLAEIERRYGDAANRRQKNLLTALVLVEASARSNTSGVFKGFHAGFGGRKADALGRILRPVTLTEPVFVEAPRGKVFSADATRLAKKLRRVEAEIAYLDPPYNQHQYGSNYHLLNTIARGDRPAVGNVVAADGRAKSGEKAAIRKDWVKTKSPYCYRSSAQAAFAELVREVRAKYVLVSYSTEGVIPLDAMIEIMARKGKIAIVTTDYTRFRGGRQTVTTRAKNVEFVLIAETGRVSTAEDVRKVRALLLADATRALEGEIFLPDGPGLEVAVAGGTVPLTRRLQIDPVYLDGLSVESLERQQTLLDGLRAALPAGHDKAVVGIAEALLAHPELDAKYLRAKARQLTDKIIARKYPQERARADLALSGMVA